MGSNNDATTKLVDLTASAKGTINFGGAIGTTTNKLGDLNTTAATTAFNSTVDAKTLNSTATTTNLNGNVTTTGTQTYTGNTTVANNPRLTGNGITFTGLVDSKSGTTSNLIVDSSADGNISFGAAVGGSTPLANLTSTTSTGTTKFSSTVAATNLTTNGSTELNGNVSTSNSQTYNGNVTLNGDRTLRGQEIDFNGGANSVTGTGNLTIDAFTTDRAIILGNSINDSSTLSLTTSDLEAINNQAINNQFSSITIGRKDSTGNVTVNGANLRTSTANIQTGTGAIAINGNLSNTGNLNIQTNSAISVNTNISNGGNLNLNAPQTQLGGNLNTSNGNISVTGTTSLNGTNREVTTGNGNITFSQNVSGTNTNLTATASSQVNFNGTVNTNSLNVKSTQTNLNGNVTTSGDQTYNATTLGNDVTFAGSNLTFNGNLDANTRLLTINARNNITSKDITSQGKTIKLDSANGGTITTGNITTGNDKLTNGGDLNISTTQTATSAITTGNITTNGKQQGGNVNLVAGQRIETGAIDTSSSSGQGGDLTISTKQTATSTITTGNITTSGNTGNITASGNQRGGDVTLIAGNQIQAGAINTSSSSDRGGNVTIDPTTVIVDSINTNGGTTGGNLKVNFNNAFLGKFLAVGSFVDRNNVTASISTAGKNSGGTININLLGNSVPFSVGSSSASFGSKNGTAENITTGSVVPKGTYFYNFTDGNTQIITGNGEDPSQKIRSASTVGSIQVRNSDIGNTVKDLIESAEQTLSEEFGQIGLFGRTKNFAEIQLDLAFLEKEVTKSKTVILYLGYQGFGQTVNSRISLKRSLITSTTSAEDAGLPSVYIPNLGKLVESFEDGVRNRSEEYKKASQELYSAIFTDDLKDQLKGVQNLIIVAGKDLRGIPFSALYDGKEYLVEKYRISIVPSLSLSNFGESNPPSAIASNQILAVGASEFPKFPKLNPLSNVPNELKLVTQGGKYYLNSDLSIDNIVKIRQQFKQSVLHIATHAIIEPQQIDQAGIYFGNEKLPLQVDTFNKLQLGANPNNKVPPLALLVLSACQSAVDSPKAELGFAGLARSAGVSTVVASLWNVADASTPALMNKFYEQLRAGSLKSEALQKAQISLLRGDKFSHPFYWATFTLVGNP